MAGGDDTPRPFWLGSLTYLQELDEEVMEMFLMGLYYGRETF